MLKKNPLSYLSAAGCKPLPTCGGARWSGFPSVPCRSSRTEIGSSAADCGSDSLSEECRHCCTPPAERTVDKKKNHHTWSISKNTTAFFRHFGVKYRFQVLTHEIIIFIAFLNKTFLESYIQNSIWISKLCPIKLSPLKPHDSDH